MTAEEGRIGRVDRLLDTITIPQPFTMTSFVDSVARARDKRLELVRTHSLDGPCGLLLSTSTVDYIFYDGASPLHVAHNILHEIGHLLLRHRFVFVDDVLGLAAPFADQPLSRLPHVAIPIDHNGADEADADHFAAVVLARASAQVGQIGGQVPGLSAAFAGPTTGWNWSPARGTVGNGIRALLAGAGARAWSR